MNKDKKCTLDVCREHKGMMCKECKLDYMESLEEEIICSLYGLPEEWNEVAKKYGGHEANYGVIGLRAKKIMEIIKKYV